MKLFLCFTLSMLGVLVTNAQQVIQARATSTSVKQMTVTYQNNIANINLIEVSHQDGLLPGVSDLANVGVTDGRFTIPNDGNTYWIVYFKDGSAARATGGASYCIDCFCEGQSGGSPGCHLINSNTCGGSCGQCLTLSKPCDDAYFKLGAIAIIKASKVVFN